MTITIEYTGCAMSGRSTSLECIRSGCRSAEPAGPSDQLTVMRAGTSVKVGCLRNLAWLEILPDRWDDAFPEVRDEVARLMRLDGIVTIIDSQEDRLEGNVEAFSGLRKGLELVGRRIEDIPVIICLNKQDLPPLFDPEVLARRIGISCGHFRKTIATRGVGVLEAFDAVLALTRSRSS